MRAEWRMRADDPKTLLGWWWRGFRRDGKLPQAVLALGIIVFCFCPSPWVVGTAVVLSGCIEPFWKFFWPDELRPLLPDPAPEGQFRASVEFRRKGLTTGTDEMAFTIVDGWLHAEGVRSDFAVRPEDVWRLRTFSDRTGTLVLADGSEVRLSGIRSESRVLLERWHVPDRWMEGEPTYPAARVHPQEFARRAGWVLSVPFVFLLMPVARLLSPGWGPYTASLLGVLVFFVGGMIWSFWRLLSLKAIDDRVIEEERRKSVAGPQPSLQGEPLRKGESTGVRP